MRPLIYQDDIARVVKSRIGAQNGLNRISNTMDSKLLDINTHKSGHIIIGSDGLLISISATLQDRKGKIKMAIFETNHFHSKFRYDWDHASLASLLLARGRNLL